MSLYKGKARVKLCRLCTRYDFVISFFVNGATTTTLPIKIYSSVKTGVSLQVNALCTLILVFVAVVMAIKTLVVDRRGNQ